MHSLKFTDRFSFNFLRLTLFVALLFFSFKPLQSQTTESDTTTPKVQTLIQVAEVSLQIEKGNVRILRLKAKYEFDQTAETISENFPETKNEIEELLESIKDVDLNEASRRILDDLRLDFIRNKEYLNTLLDRLMRKSTEIEEDRNSLKDAAIVWTKTLENAIQEEVPKELTDRITSFITDINDFENELKIELSELLVLQDGILDLDISMTRQVNDIEAAQKYQRLALLSLDSKPIWNAKADSTQNETFTEQIEELKRAMVWSLGKFKEIYQKSFTTYLFFLLILLVIFVGLYTRRKQMEIDSDDLKPVKRIIYRPIESATLIWLLFFPLIFFRAPVMVLEISFIVITIPLIRYLNGLFDTSVRFGLYLISFLVVYSILLDHLFINKVSYRILLLIETIIAGYGIYILLRESRNLKKQVGNRRFIISNIAPFAMITLIISVIANIVGAVYLAKLFTFSTVSSIFIAIGIYGGMSILMGAIDLAMKSPLVRKLNIIAQHEELVKRKLFFALKFGAIIVWGIATLIAFDLYFMAGDWFRDFSEKTFEFGTLHITVNDILGFVFVLWFSVILSRLVRFLLAEEILIRIKLPRGVPYTISLMIRYLFISIGFFIALAIAGIEFDRLTIVFGALGVGIGFGLQSIFNNIVSGLILAFERPIKVGDIIEIGPLLGTVKVIGIRASTIRTFDGAEIIVPNGNLISNELINWTLTDGIRRMEVKVGVAYGTDPDQVLEILVNLAKQNPNVIDYPKPFGIFNEFGESSLDFSVYFWIGNVQMRMQIKSEVTLAINKALKAEGIKIPFPQRDLHVKPGEPITLPDKK